MKDRRLWIIFLIIFVNLLGFGIILPLLPYYVESLGAGAITIGLLSAAYSIFQLVAAPILGDLSDKYGRRPVLLFSIAGTTISFFLMGWAQTLTFLFIARMIDGASGGNISTAQAYIADVTSPEERTQSMGMMMAAFSLGFILGPALGGLLSVYGYAVPAYVAGAVALVSTLLTYFFLPESLPASVKAQVAVEKKKRRNPLFMFHDFKDALQHAEVGLLLTISFLMMFGFTLMQGTFALFTEHTLHLTARSNGLIFAYMGILGILMQMVFLKPILKRVPEHRAILWSIVVMAMGLGLIAVGSLVSVFVGVTFLSLGNGISGPLLAGHISKSVSATEQGNIAGMNQSVGSMARLIGPVLGTLLYSSLGKQSPYYLATGVLFLTAWYGWKNLRPVEVGVVERVGLAH